MDVLTHFVIPYVLAALLGRPGRERVAAGIGGYAPDADVFTGWLGHQGPAWEAFGHRGLSHSALGAPLYALAVFGLVSLPVWRRWFPRLAGLEFTPRLVAAAIAGSLLHVGLDALTTWGVPLGYPFSVERVSADAFSYHIVPMVLLSAYVLYLIVRRRASDRAMRAAALGFVLVFAAAGSVRAYTHPDVGEDVWTVPGEHEWTWTSFHRNGTTWTVTYWSWGVATHAREYREMLPETEEAEAALATARATAEYRSFRLFGGYPEVVQVQPHPEGGWTVLFLDLLRRSQADERPDRLRGTSGEEGLLELWVRGPDVTRLRS